MVDDPEPIRDDELDDGTRWGRFASGLPMRGDDRASGVLVWDVFAVGLAVAAALLFLSSIVQAFNFFGVSMRDRAFIAAVDGSSTLTAGLAAAAVVIETALGEPWKRRLGRWAVAGGSVISVAILASAAYAVAYLALAHPYVDIRDFSEAMIRVAQATTSWSVRLQGILHAVASGVLAGAAIYVVRRAAATPTRPSPSGELSAS